MDNSVSIKEKIKVLKRMKRDTKYLWIALQKEINEYNINVEYKFKNYDDSDKKHFAFIIQESSQLTNKIEKIENIIKELENE